MIRAAIVLAAVAVFAPSPALLATDKGTWQESWPEELEPLRKHARTAVGSEVLREHYDISFATREASEWARPHLLKVKSRGAPIILVRGPDTWLGKMIDAGVRIHAPPTEEGRRVRPEEPVPGKLPVRQRSMGPPTSS